MSSSIRNSFRLFILVASLLLGLAVCVAQDQVGSRKPTVQKKPDYPELAKKMNVSGTVRMEVSVAPDGAVKNSKPLGGNPVLIRAAETAVKQWKFEPAAKPSVEVVTFRFNPE